MGEYDASEAELLLADFADKEHVKEAAPPIAALDQLIKTFEVLAKQVGIRIEVESGGSVMYVARTATSTALIQYSQRTLTVGAADAFVKINVFWNPYRRRFESREIDKDGKRRDPLALLTEAVLAELAKK